MGLSWFVTLERSICFIRLGGQPFQTRFWNLSSAVFANNRNQVGGMWTVLGKFHPYVLCNFNFKMIRTNYSLWLSEPRSPLCGRGRKHMPGIHMKIRGPQSSHWLRNTTTPCVEGRKHIHGTHVKIRGPQSYHWLRTFHGGQVSWFLSWTLFLPPILLPLRQ